MTRSQTVVDKTTARLRDRLTDTVPYAPYRALTLTAVILYGVTQIPRGLLRMALHPLFVCMAVATAIPAALVAMYVWDSGVTKRGASAAVAVASTVGVGITSVAFTLNENIHPVFTEIPVLGELLFFFLFLAPMEEALKIAPVYVLHRETDLVETPLHGAMYGAASALGFTVIENSLYILSYGVLGTASLVGIVVGRALVSQMHIVWSSIAGYSVTTEDSGRHGRLVMAAPILLHATYNTVVEYSAVIMESISSIPPRPVTLGLCLIVCGVGWLLLEYLIESTRRKPTALAVG